MSTKIQNRNLCHTNTYARVGGTPAFGGGFIGLSWVPETGRMMVTLTRLDRTVAIVAMPAPDGLVSWW